MDLKEAIDYCSSKLGAFEDHPFGPEPIVIKVGSKMFALISEKDGCVNISLKCNPILAQNLRQQYESIQPGYHLNKEHWNTVVLNGSIPVSEIEWMIDHSFKLVAKSLTKSQTSYITSPIIP